MFVGHLDKLSLSAVVMASSFASVIGFSLLTGMSSALDTVCGQSYGAKQYHMLGIQMQRAMVVQIVAVPLALIWANTGHLLRFLGQDPFQNDIFCLSERDLLNRFAAEIALLQSNGESKEHAFMEKAKKMRHAFDTLTKAMEVQAMNMSSEVSMMKKEVMCVVKERESK